MNSKLATISIITIFVIAIIGFTLSSVNNNDSQKQQIINENKISIESDDEPILVERKPKTDIEEETTDRLTTEGIPYVLFNEVDYQKALDEGKIIYLEFYADWCPTCRSQEPKLIEGLKQIDNNNIVAFKVNYKDSDTDSFEEELADKYNVTYQHTKVIIVDGQAVYNQVGIWDSEDVVSNLSQY